MNEEERRQVQDWINYGLCDELIGANWHQNLRNKGLNPPRETFLQTGERLRLELRQQQKRG